MNTPTKSLLLAVLISAFNLHGFGQKTLFNTRSQAANSARELAGWQQIIYRPDLIQTNAAISITPEYSRSFRNSDIAKFLFGCPELVFSGSQVIGREDTDILADYFGLPSDFKSVVQFDPVITNFVMDLNWHIGFDGSVPGLYLGVHIPIVHTKWDLNLSECVVDAGSTFTSYPAGYLAADPIELTALTTGEKAPKNVKTVFQGKAVFGDMQEPLKYGKIFGRQNETRVGELQVVLGYNFLLTDRYHAGVAVCAAAPTGTLRKSEFLFEPIAGNDHHWELGGAFTAHMRLWQNIESEKQLLVYLDANVSHLFASGQKRSFDLKENGAGSRYMLLETIFGPAVGLHNGVSPNDTEATVQYQGDLVPAINRTTLDAKIAIGLQADVTAKLSYQRRGFEFDLGYNFWYRSAEKCEGRECIKECYGVKGDAQVYGFTNPGQTAVGLAATQSKATINQGQAATDSAFTNVVGNFSSGNEYANVNADNITIASDTLGTALWQLTAADANRLGVSQQSVRTSNPEVLVTNDDIDECSALMPKAISHKLFAYAGYTLDRPDMGLIPYVGVGAFVEWADTNSCDNSAAAQWGLWFKIGAAFGMI